jgi:hypothetical protein
MTVGVALRGIKPLQRDIIEVIELLQIVGYLDTRPMCTPLIATEANVEKAAEEFACTLKQLQAHLARRSIHLCGQTNRSGGKH